ncbi:MAG: DnaJ domain-containing protein [Thermomicrobiales bacterium]
MFPLIGARDYIEARGFFIHDCPTCTEPTVFSVYETRRKLTLYFVPTLKVRSQHVMECMTCHGKWGIPDDVHADVLGRLMSQEELSARVRQMNTGGGAQHVQRFKGRTLYQVLQVDPMADPDVIDAAFKRLALKFHPDRSTQPDAPARMREILEAKAILGDPVKRSLYDRSIGIVHRIDALHPDEV